MNEPITRANERRPENVQAVAALTPMQQGILFFSLGAKERDPYFQQLVLELRGDLDVAALEHAWQRAVDRHPVLRADYRYEESATPLQVIYKSRHIEWERADWRDLSSGARAARLRALLDDERRAGFDFRRASDLRLRLIRVGETVHWFSWSHHHIALDGWSLGLVLEDVLNLYEAQRRGLGIEPWVGLAFTDYLAWLGRREPERATRYWRERLAGIDEKTPLPATASGREASHVELSVTLDAGETELLRRRCRDLEVTPSTLVQGAWALLLGRWAGVREVVFGATVSGRPEGIAGAERGVGLFINTLPMRVRLDPAQRLRDWLRELTRQNLESREHGHLSLAEIRRAAGRTGDEPLFDSVVVFENFPVDEALRRQPYGLEVEFLRDAALHGRERQTHGRNNYPLTLNVVPGATFTLSLAYGAERFDGASMRRWMECLRALLLDTRATGDRCLGSLGLALESAPGPSSAEPPGHAPLVLERFAARVRDQPVAAAVREGNTGLDYATLDAVSNRIARALIALGVGAEARVALCADRGTEFVASLLGILKAGAAYVPLDPQLPPARLAELYRESGAALLVASRDAAALARSCAERVETSENLVRSAPDPRPVSRTIHPEQLAYVIFTSGSTGKPKGVAVSHGALGRYVTGLLERLRVDASVSMAMVSTVAADLGHTVLFGALCNGSCLNLIDRETAFDPDRFAEAMTERDVGVLKIVPSHLRALLQARDARGVLPARALIVGGEASDRGLVERVKALAPECRLFNHYGPTETTVGVCMHEHRARVDSEALPIGWALPGAELHVLDRDLNPLPAGVAGELFIGGQRLARGYQGNPGATAERFVPDPFRTGGRLYRTGDKVVRRDDGSLEFIGRFDRQIKIRGYRVELGEIEARLARCPGVARALVVSRAGHEGGRRILAYAVPAGGAAPIDEAALSAQLARELPDYMVPSRILILARLPLTENGKIDPAALPDEAPAPGADHAEPTTETERTLVEVWREVLRVERIGVSDDFFALGGDSILSLQLCARARRRGLRLKPQHVFERRTIRDLALAAEPVRAEPSRAPAPALAATREVPLLPLQQRFFERGLAQPQRYTQSLWLEARGPLDPEQLERALRHVVARHGALRCRYTPAPAGGWQQHEEVEPAPEGAAAVASRAADGMFQCRVAADAVELDALLREAHERLDLERGRLLSALLIATPGQRQRLLLVIHHLAVDGVSWRVLLEDLELAYEQLGRSERVELPEAATSVGQWADELARHARGAARSELDHWRAQCSGPGAGTPQHEGGAAPDRVRDAQSVGFSLDERQTRQLLTAAPQLWQAEAQELLLTALARAFCRWAELPSLLVELEGHGREDLGQGLDLSRTVGWLTSAFPVLLTPRLAGDGDRERSIESVKAALRSTPRRGVGYGALRYLGDEAVRAELRRLGEPKVSFNYLGQFDQAIAGSRLFSALEAASGAGQNGDDPLPHSLAFSAHVYAGALRVRCVYGGRTQRREPLERLARELRFEIESLLAASAPSRGAERERGGRIEAKSAGSSHG